MPQTPPRPALATPRLSEVKVKSLAPAAVGYCNETEKKGVAPLLPPSLLISACFPFLAPYLLPPPSADTNPHSGVCSGSPFASWASQVKSKTGPQHLCPITLRSEPPSSSIWVEKRKILSGFWGPGSLTSHLYSKQLKGGPVDTLGT